MTVITIQERKNPGQGPNADLVMDHGVEFPITITDPFSAEDEERLEWYFEEHLLFPFTNQVRYRDAAASIGDYGEALFAQVFEQYFTFLSAR